MRYFYCLLKGEVQVLRRRDDGSEEVLNTLGAGEYFGENSLLEGNRNRSVSMRCASPVEVLKLSREDFEAGFGQVSAEKSAQGVGGAPCKTEAERAEEALRAKLIGFIQMVSRKQGRTLTRDQTVFCEGAPAAPPLLSPCCGCRD